MVNDYPVPRCGVCFRPQIAYSIRSVPGFSHCSICQMMHGRFDDEAKRCFAEAHPEVMSEPNRPGRPIGEPQVSRKIELMAEGYIAMYDHFQKVWIAYTPDDRVIATDKSQLLCWRAIFAHVDELGRGENAANGS